MAQTIQFSISNADAAYAATNQSGPLLQVLGAPYHPYNYTAAAARAEVLGQAIRQSSVPASFEGQAFADAFTTSFQTQTGRFQSLYGGYTIAAGSLIAAGAANESGAFEQMFLQVHNPRLSTTNLLLQVHCQAGKQALHTWAGSQTVYTY